MCIDVYRRRGSWFFETVCGREAAVERTRMYLQRVSKNHDPHHTTATLSVET